jgi:1-acyl-sn-glycerol-3-phosphate acyltransferase
MSPEGTRKRIDTWKSGFYYIAKGANIPIIMTTLDFGNKEVKISEPFYTTDDKEKDFELIYQYFKGVKGKIPENFNL